MPTPTSPNRTASLTRRQALQTAGAGVGALWAWGSAPPLGAAPVEPTFRFIVANDLHYMSDECGAWLTRVVTRMQEHGKLDVCLVAGDLTEQGSRRHLTALREVLAGLPCPVQVVIGNHDYEAKTGDRGHYDAVFPDQINYHFEQHGWQFIALDTSDGLRYRETLVQPHTLRWLDAHLPDLDPRKPTVVFTHFPLGPGVTYRPSNADDVLERLRGFRVQAMFSGHFHGRTERMDGTTPLFTNACCALKRNNHDGTKAKGYQLCTVRDGALEVEFVEV